MLKEISYIRYNNQSNLNLKGPEAKKALEEDLKLFRKFRGKTIMENSPGARDIKDIIDLSKTTGVNVILGTGYHLGPSSSDSNEKIYDHLYKEFVIGMDNEDNYDVRAGFIGEIRPNWPIGPNDKRLLSMVGQLQKQVRSVVTILPGNNKLAPYEVLRYYQEGGGSESKVLMLHTNRLHTNVKGFLEYMDLSRCYISIDHFGIDSYNHQNVPNQCILSDDERVKYLLELKKKKPSHSFSKDFIDRIILSHGIHTKHKLRSYGGHGLSHIYRNIVPTLKNLAFTEEQINKLILENAQQWLRG